jgi:hypothetical protein
MIDHILPFPIPHRGDPEPHRMALAALGFQWRAGLWRRGRVVLSDAEIDAMEARRGARCLQRWTWGMGTAACGNCLKGQEKASCDQMP